MREIIRQAAARGITALIGTDALSSMIAAQDIDWIPLRPGRGGLVRAFFSSYEGSQGTSPDVWRYGFDNPPNGGIGDGQGNAGPGHPQSK